VLTEVQIGCTNGLRLVEKLNTICQILCGDLDSIRDEVKEFYTARGAKCIRMNNQDYTDFSKTLLLATYLISKHDSSLIKYIISEADLSQLNILPNAQISKIYCFCDFGGRVDHAVSNLSTLYQDCLKNVQTYIVSSESITFLLNSGENFIYIAKENESKCGKYCGFFPLGEPSLVTTKGLKWEIWRVC
jgi:thiamine pyrophosphokinase